MGDRRVPAGIVAKYGRFMPLKNQQGHRLVRRSKLNWSLTICCKTQGAVPNVIYEEATRQVDKMTVDTAEEISSRIEEFQNQDYERTKWIKAISGQLAEVTQNYNDVTKDLKRERMVGRMTQDDAEQWKQRFFGLQNAVERNSFVLVLIDADADAYLFKPEYYTSVDGGRKAALELRNSIHDHLQRTAPESANLPIVIKAFANSDGLSQFLVKSKTIKSQNVLWDFAKGFSQSSQLSDFILVGAGKDRADKKIEGVFEHFVGNPTCRYVFFAACHDNGYVRLLEKYVVDDAIRERVILLHSFEVGREFASLNFKSIKLDTVFASLTFKSIKMDAAFGSKSLTGTKSPVSPPPSCSSSQAKSERAATLATWTKKVKATNPANNDKTTISLKEKDLPLGSVLVNAAGQRVDSQLPQSSQKGLDGWNRKTKVANTKYCRKYHIQGSCPGHCGYSHGLLSADEHLVYRNNLRREACHIGMQCRDPACFYGHSCACKKNHCIFSAAMHSVDSSTARIWKRP